MADQIIAELERKGFEDEALIKEMQVITGASRDAVRHAIAFHNGEDADDVIEFGEGLNG